MNKTMTNAEERAWEAYPDYPSRDGGYITQRKTRSIFINGYRQAIDDVCEWIKQQQEMPDDCFSDAGDFQIY